MSYNLDIVSYKAEGRIPLNIYSYSFGCDTSSLFAVIGMHIHIPSQLPSVCGVRSRYLVGETYFVRGVGRNISYIKLYFTR